MTIRSAICSNRDLKISYVFKKRQEDFDQSQEGSSQ